MVSFNNTLKKFSTVFTRAASGVRMTGTQSAFIQGVPIIPLGCLKLSSHISVNIKNACSYNSFLRSI